MTMDPMTVEVVIVCAWELCWDLLAFIMLQIHLNVVQYVEMDWFLLQKYVMTEVRIVKDAHQIAMELYQVGRALGEQKHFPLIALQFVAMGS